MSRIRRLERADLPQVADLYERELGTGAVRARAGMAEHLERLFLDDPWVDPDIPARVFEDDDGSIGGFIGSNVRRMRFKGEPARRACPGPLVTEPNLRLVAALLMRKYFAGPQDLTMSDRHTLASQRLFERLGGHVLHLQCLRWIHVFRPLALKGYHLARLKGMRRFDRVIRPTTRALDGLAPLPGKRPTEPPGLHAEELTPRALADNLTAITASLDLYPDYREPYLVWLFDHLRRLESKGTLTAVLVRDDDQQVKGWYVYFQTRDGPSDVVQIGATRGNEGVILRHLFHHAAHAGAAALRGRLEPNLREPLRSMHCQYHQGTCLLVHTKNPAILDAVASGRALLSTADGELPVSETFREPTGHGSGVPA